MPGISLLPGHLPWESAPNLWILLLFAMAIFRKLLWQRLNSFKLSVRAEPIQSKRCKRKLPSNNSIPSRFTNGATHADHALRLSPDVFSSDCISADVRSGPERR